MPQNTGEMPQMRGSGSVRAGISLYVATTNPGKLRDFANAAGQKISLAPLPGLAAIPAPVEDAPTFEGNARAKAIYYSIRAPGLLVLADDSGLEVDALDGAPGVHSARYADDVGYPAAAGDSVDRRNNVCLLEALSQVPRDLRRARYRCILAVARNGYVIQIADGVVAGEILTAPRGEDGFGYDPLFYLPAFQRTMAELDPVTRLACSHRGNALRQLLRVLPL